MLSRYNGTEKVILPDPYILSYQYRLLNGHGQVIRPFLSYYTTIFAIYATSKAIDSTLKLR